MIIKQGRICQNLYIKNSLRLVYMNEIIKKDILSILKELIDILKVKEVKDVVEIRELSNHIIHNASIFQDEDSISIAVLIYALSKIIERKQGELDYGVVLKLLEDTDSCLIEGNTSKYRETIQKLFKFVSTIDTKLEMYIEEVFKQAEIKKGSKLYEHGISSARAAEIMNISQWELMSYIGKTTLADIPKEAVDLKSRLELARSLFK